MSNERFAEHLDIAVRTVSTWHEKPDTKPQSENQQLLDAAYERASASVRKRFAERTGTAIAAPSHEPVPVDDQARTDAELRLTADPHITDALEWLDDHAGWAAGTARRNVAERLATLDVPALRDRATRRGAITHIQITQTLLDYYATTTEEHGAYRATSGQTEITTTILTCPAWLDLACPLLAPTDGLTLNPDAGNAPTGVDELTTHAAVERIADTLELGTQMVNMPLYRLLETAPTPSGINGNLGVAPFVQYALTTDLLEGELLDAIANSQGAKPGQLPLRDRYLPDAATVTNLTSRLCAGGVLALCAIARPAGRHGDPDYLLLIQQRSGNVVNANRQLAVIPKGFHQPVADVRGDTQLGATLLREMEEELFGRNDIDNTIGDQRSADPMHPNRLSEPMRWLLERPMGERLQLESTGFGINLVSGNYEFPSLILIEDEEFWTRYGGQIEANWESSTLRPYSSLDTDLLAELIGDVAWSNEGLFALLQGLRRLDQLGGQRVKLPTIEWEIR